MLSMRQARVSMACFGWEGRGSIKLKLLDRQQVICMSAHLAVCRACNDNVSHMKGACLDKQRGDRSNTLVQVSLQHCASSCSVRIAHQILKLRHKSHSLKELIHSSTLFGADLHTNNQHGNFSGQARF